MEFVFGIVLIVLFDLAALKWGFDSRDKIDSPEWERRSRSRRAIQARFFF